MSIEDRPINRFQNENLTYTSKTTVGSQFSFINNSSGVSQFILS